MTDITATSNTYGSGYSDDMTEFVAGWQEQSNEEFKAAYDQSMVDMINNLDQTTRNKQINAAYTVSKGINYS